MTKSTKPNQIIRIDGKNLFLEVLNTSFEIDRVHLNFVQYDQAQATGSRIVANIPIYLEFAEFLALSEDVIMGFLQAKAAAIAADAAATKQYPKPAFIAMGGTSAKVLVKRGQARADGMSESRQFKISSGTKYPFLLTAESGAGKEDERGLIVPAFGSKPDKRIMLGMSAEDLKSLCMIVKFHMQSYITSQYMTGTWNALRPQKQDQGQNTHYPEPPPEYGSRSTKTVSQTTPSAADTLAPAASKSAPALKAPSVPAAKAPPTPKKTPTAAYDIPYPEPPPEYGNRRKAG